MIQERMAQSPVRFVDRNGKPLTNSRVHVKLINHEFLFGCGAFEAVPYANHEENGRPREFMEDRMRKWLDLFNYGTLPFYWGRFEPVEGQPRTEEYRRAAEFLKSRGVTLKGHPLCWQTVHAAWLLKYDTETILEKQLDRITREVGDFKGLVDLWDVINEACIMPVYDRYDNAATRICKAKGRVGLCKLLFERAQEVNPDGTFLINDFNMSQEYFDLIAECLEAGVPIKAIGLQSHQHQRLWSAEWIEELLSRVEPFGLPIHFTENTIVSGPLVDPSIRDLQDAHYADDAATPEYEELQADRLEKMYRQLFERHPQVVAITNWDFGDGAWLNAPSGVIRRDNSLKPSYSRLHHLIREEWHTEGDIMTDENGIAAVEGYRGTYQAGAGTFCLENGNAMVNCAVESCFS